MPNVFSMLEQDHAEVKALIARLTSTSTGETLQKLAEQLVMEESRHEAVEEMCFWPSVRENLDAGNELAEMALKQEQEGKEILDKIRTAEPGDAEFSQLVRQFATAGSEHILFEEEHVWPKLRMALSAAVQDELGAKMEKAKSAAPTRPHPHTPPSPGALKTAGTGAALVDKARDALIDRG